MAWWPVIAAALSKPWPVEAVFFDLRWWEDQEEAGKARRPGRPSLVARWGIGDRMARNIIDKPALWSLSSVGPTEVQSGSSKGPAKVQPREGGTLDINEKGPAKVQLGSNLGPGKVQSGSSDKNPDSTTSNGDALLSEIGTDREQSQNAEPERRSQIEHHAAREADPVLLRVLLFATRSHGMHASTEAAEPATPTTPQPPPSETGVRVVAPRAETLLSLTAAPAPKPKRGKGKGTETPAQQAKRERADAAIRDAEANFEAWGVCCQHWQAITGKLGKMSREAGHGADVMRGIQTIGRQRMIDRFAVVAAGESPSARGILKYYAESGFRISLLCWQAGQRLLTDLDSEIAQARLEGSPIGEKRSCEPSRASGGVGGGVVVQNAPQRQQDASWGDVLRDIGSDPQTHPEDGPHRKAWPEVRAAIYAATRTAGDAWETWCKADDPTRHKVERVLSRRVMA